MIAVPSMTLTSISGASEKESPCQRQGKMSDFFFGNFGDQFCDSDGGIA